MQEAGFILTPQQILNRNRRVYLISDVIVEKAEFGIEQDMIRRLANIAGQIQSILSGLARQEIATGPAMQRKQLA